MTQNEILFTDDCNNKVKQGMALLDEREPGWFRKIDTEILDLSNPKSCILGQAWRDKGGMDLYFTTALTDLGMYDDDATEAHGFALDEDAAKKYSIGWHQAYSILTEQWIYYIKKKLAII